MRNKVQKGRCIKLSLDGFEEVVKTYDELQLAAAKFLSSNRDFVDCQCNVESCTIDDTKYTTDFVAKDKGGKLTALECVQRKNLTKPKTIKLLDESQRFWCARGIEWGLILDKEGGTDE